MASNPFPNEDVMEVANKATDICRRITWHGYIEPDAPSEAPTMLRALYPEDAVRQVLSAAGHYDVVNPIYHVEPQSVWPEAEELVRRLIPKIDEMLAKREKSALAENARRLALRK